MTVRTDSDLLESEARLEVGGEGVARIEAALGSPQRPMDAESIERKVRSLSGDRLTGLLDDPDRPVRDVVEASRLLH